MKKKILSIILCMVMVLGMIISPLPSKAFDFSQEPAYSKLSFTPQELPAHESIGDTGTYPYMLGDDATKTDCAIQKYEIVLSAGYTCLLAYNVPEDGKLRLGYTNWGDDYFTIGIGNSNKTGRAAEFSITDADGNILYPTDGKVAVLDENNPIHTAPANQTIDVKKGTVYFVLHSVSGQRNSFTARDSNGEASIVHFLGDSGDIQLMDWSYWPMDAVKSSFSFQYATDYAKVYDSGLDLGSVYQKKLEFNKQLMVKNTTGMYDTFSVGVDVPNYTYCGTNFYNVFSSQGYANITTFVAPESGTFKLSSMYITLGNNYTSQSLSFAVTDEEGNILWPTDKSILTIGGEVQSQTSIGFTRTVEVGDEINFVCFDANTNVSAQLLGEFYINGKSYSTASNSHLWPDDWEKTAGNDNNHDIWKYYYSTDVTVKNVMKASWGEFIELEKYNYAPNTIEAWVKISSAVADTKKSIIVSNGGVNDYEDDLTIEMGYKGKPHLYNASKNIDFKVDYDLRTDEWTHLAFVNDKTANKMFCYINGELKGTYDGSYDNAQYGTEYGYVIGNNSYYDKGNAFQGEIRDVRFWSDVRTESEIADNMNVVISGSEADLLGAWALNDYSSLTQYFPDKTAQNHGYIVSPYNKFVQADAVTDYDYSMAVIGDTQYYAESDSNIQKFYDITNYIAGLEQKPEYVMHVGDITSSNSVTEYEKVTQAMNTLTTAGIPQSIALGNHDYPSASKAARNSTMFNSYFNQDYYESVNDYRDNDLSATGFYSEYYEVDSTYTGTKWLVIADDAETVNDGEIKLASVITRVCESQEIAVGDYVAIKTDNNYRTFTAGSTNYLLITLEFNPRDAVITWANEVVSSHSEYKTIVLTHGYTSSAEIISTTSYFPTTSETEGQNVSTALWDKFVRKHENIFMLFCGHSHAPDITSNVAVGDNGNTIYQFMVAPTMGNGGDGVFLMMYFNEAKGTVDFRYYSPSENAYWGYQNMFQIELDNSKTNTEIVEITKPNIVKDGIMKSFSTSSYAFPGENGTWCANDDSNVSDLWNVRVIYDKYTQGIQTSDAVSMIRQYKVESGGTGKFLIDFGLIKTGYSSSDTHNESRSVDFAIYNSDGENITAMFSTGDTAADAVAKTGSTKIALNNDAFHMVSKSGNKGWLYAEIPDVKAGDSFYFVTTANGGKIFQNQMFYVGGDIQHSESTPITLSGVDGTWAKSQDDYWYQSTGTVAVSTKSARQGYRGWYYKYVYDSALNPTGYSAKNVEVNATILGEGTITMYTKSATYDETTGKITLPHHNSLFIDAKRADGYVLSAVYYKGLGVAFSTSTSSSIRVNIPCVEDGGDLLVIFKPTAAKVTVNGVSDLYDYDTVIPLNATAAEGYALDSWDVSDTTRYDSVKAKLLAADGLTAEPVFAQIVIGNVNGTDGVDIRDLVRLVTYLNDSSVEIKTYNSDIYEDEVIDDKDKLALRNLLLNQ